MLLLTFFIACIVTAMENFILGPVAYKLHKSDLTKRWLFLCVCIGTWSLGLAFEGIVENSNVALFWARFYYCGVVFIPATFFHFISSSLGIVRDKIKIIKAAYAMSSALFIVNLFGGITNSVSPKFIFKYTADAGLFYPLLILYFFTFVIYSIYLQFKNIIKTQGYERAKAIYILIASAIGFVSTVSLFFTPYKLCPYAFVGMYIIWVYPIVIVYAIATVHLMDIEVFMHRSTRALIGIVFFFFLLYVSYFTLQNTFQSFFGKFWFILPTFIFGIGLVCLVFFVRHVFKINEEDLLEKFAYRPILKELAKRTAQSKSIEELLAFTARFTSLYAKLDYIGIFLLDENEESYKLVRSLTRTHKRKKIPIGEKIEQNNPIILYLRRSHGTINLFKIKFELEKRTLKFNKKRQLITLRKEMEKRQAVLCIPCYSEDMLLGFIFLSAKANKEMFLSKDEDMFFAIADQLAKPIHNFMHKKKAIEGFINSQEVVVRAVEAKDPYTRGHSERVAKISYQLGKSAGINKTDLQSLKYAARLHDIGKIAIKDAVLNKESKLTNSEYEEIKKHPQESAKMIQPIAKQLGPDVIDAILHHHENIDGSGYPDGQTGNDIHIFAKTIRVADTLDALVTNRPYRKSRISMEKVMEEFNRNKDKKFDNNITQKIIELCKDKMFLQWLKKLIKETGATSRLK